MRERITFLHAANHPFDPQQLRVENDTLHVSSLVAAREDRLTFSLYELPQEVGAVLSKEYIYIISSVANLLSVMAGFETMSRDTLAMGLFHAVSINCPARRRSLPRFACLLHTARESLGVCEHILISAMTAFSC